CHGKEGPGVTGVGVNPPDQAVEQHTVLGTPRTGRWAAKLLRPKDLLESRGGGHPIDPSPLRVSRGDENRAVPAALEHACQSGRDGLTAIGAVVPRQTG